MFECHVKAKRVQMGFKTKTVRILKAHIIDTALVKSDIKATAGIF